MSPIQAPTWAHYPRASFDPVPSGTDFPLIKTFYPHDVLLEEDYDMTIKKAESIAQHKLPIYQAAAVVSTVLAGIESQLLVFFKSSSPDFTQKQAPVILQYLLVLTYIALVFSVSNTMSSLVLTRNFGNVPMLAARFREKIKGTGMPSFQTKVCHDITPRRWRLIELHWLFTLVVSVLCLPAQIFLYIWMQERNAIRAAVSVAGVFSMLPLLHFLPIPWRGVRKQAELISPPFYPGIRWAANSPGGNLLPAPASMSLPPAIYTMHPASHIGY